MNKLKVVKITSAEIEFSNGITLSSEHDQDCCENHTLTLTDLTMEDFDGLEFDLSNDQFFKRIEGYGIELIPINGYSIRIPGHGNNNGYYSNNLSLVIYYKNILVKIYDITECQQTED